MHSVGIWAWLCNVHLEFRPIWMSSELQTYSTWLNVATLKASKASQHVFLLMVYIHTEALICLCVMNMLALPRLINTGSIWLCLQPLDRVVQKWICHETLYLCMVSISIRLCSHSSAFYSPIWILRFTSSIWHHLNDDIWMMLFWSRSHASRAFLTH